MIVDFLQYLFCTKPGGSDKWDDTPRWRKEEIGEWDQDRGGGGREDESNNNR